MMVNNEDTTVQAVKATFRASKITTELLLSVVRMTQKQIVRRVEKHRSTGEQDLKHLTKPGLAINQLGLEYSNMDVEALKAALKDYGLDFHLKHDQEHGRFELWYRVKDGPQLQAAMEQVVRNKMRQGPDIHQQVKDSQKQASHQAPGPKTAEKGDRVKDIDLER